jgi:GMP synthase (glutamine-hydrolysing)
MHSKVLILDFGSQFTQLIARKTRELGVYSEILPFDVDIDKIKNDEFVKAIIFSGGPNSVYDQNAPEINKEIYSLGLPILGTCYGLQLIGKDFGGTVEKANSREYGRAFVDVCGESLLTKGLRESSEVWMSHGDHLVTLPEGFELILSSENCKFSAIANESQKIYAVQFHPEVYHSGVAGKQILSNFLFEIAKIGADWNAGNFIEEQCEIIRQKVGSDKVICGLSGGVDSAVVASIINEAIGSQLHCVFVDTGLLRLNEKEEVQKAFRDHFNVSLTVADASEVFLSRLKGVSDPETKRKIIGSTFIDVFELAKKHQDLEIRIDADLNVTKVL